ncbi:Holliday junction resolvase RuvX [Salinibacterium sp. NK8237]|uniref:Holliday junction resolvase RuvX n=1 Tax=Salinibacterium sp. NK8237 TaxID=2792038 RepID=UPI0018CD46F6|nr:Holliday junction resolvase RuvX [Salinibacterium sp. NK8237]MBH0129083.1 Holliday junction resolvase RuvX [Salinibacterium sp. NK8237]
MRAGTRIGVDVGKVRVGVARSDPHGMLATPVETVQRAKKSVKRILALAEEYEAVEFVVGLPIALSGRDTASTGDAREFAQQLADRSSLPVRLVDERMTTMSAQSALRASGRTTKNSRSVVDQVAAVIILQHALDFERSAARPPGELVDPTQGP